MAHYARFAFTIKRVKSPIHGDFRGWQMIAAAMNLARYDVRSEEYVQSFAPKYRLAESGYTADYPTPQEMAEFLAQPVLSGATAVFF